MSRRGRPPKYDYSTISEVHQNKTEHSAQTDLRQKKDKKRDYKKEVFTEVENIQKVVSNSLRSKIREIDNLNNINNELLEKNRALEMDHTRLLQQIDEKDLKLVEHNQKISKLVELIHPLQTKIKEQEVLREQLNKFRVVNKELENNLLSKKKELKTIKAMSDASSKMRRDDESKVVEERRRLEILDKELKSEEAKLQCKEKCILDEKKKIEIQLRTLKETKKELDEDRKVLDEERKELDNDKIDIDTEWGHIMLEKEKIKNMETLMNTDKADAENTKLNMMERENKQLQKQVSSITQKFDELMIKHDGLMEQLNASKEGSRNELADLKADIINIKLTKTAMEMDIKSKNKEISVLQQELDNYKQNYRVTFNKDEIRDEELNMLKLRNSSTSEKRKMVDEKVPKVAFKKMKSEASLANLDSEESLEYLPSDAETGIDETDSVDINAVESDFANSKKVNMDLTKSRHTESTVDILGNTEEVNAGVEGLDSSKALRQIADFESFIKNKRLKDLTFLTLAGVEESDGERNMFKGDSKEPASKSEGSEVIKDREMYENFETRHFESEEENVSSRLAISKENILSTFSKTCTSREAVSIVSNFKDQSNNILKSEKSLLVLKKIDTLIAPSVIDKDVIIPRISDSCDLATGISDSEDSEVKQKQDKAEREIKFNVGEFVTSVLNNFYKKEHGIESREEFSKIASEFTNRFVEDIKGSYGWTYGSLSGLSMSKDDKLSITDQIYLYFNVKVVVTKHLARYLNVRSTGSHEISKTIEMHTARLTQEIKESFWTAHSTLMGVSMNEDIKSWIRIKIDAQFS